MRPAPSAAGSRPRRSQLARDLANTPPTHLTATRLAEVAVALGAEAGSTSRSSTRQALVELGCGGLLGVNAGSAEPPRMIKLTYTPGGDGRRRRAGHLALVGKGIMYDSGGISLKPGDAMHAQMKNDMSARRRSWRDVASARPRLPDRGHRLPDVHRQHAVGHGDGLGDVITIRGGTTVEVVNTDAEGRLVMADALVLATEEPHRRHRRHRHADRARRMRALGTEVAGVSATTRAWSTRSRRRRRRTDEPVWQLPLDQALPRKLDSDRRRPQEPGRRNAGAITAGAVPGGVRRRHPVAHIDIAGTAQTDTDDSWRSTGLHRLRRPAPRELALEFRPPRG